MGEARRGATEQASPAGRGRAAVESGERASRIRRSGRRLPRGRRRGTRARVIDHRFDAGLPRYVLHATCASVSIAVIGPRRDLRSLESRSCTLQQTTSCSCMPNRSSASETRPKHLERLATLWPMAVDCRQSTFRSTHVRTRSDYCQQWTSGRGRACWLRSSSRMRGGSRPTRSSRPRFTPPATPRSSASRP